MAPYLDTCSAPPALPGVATSGRAGHPSAGAGATTPAGVRDDEELAAVVRAATQGDQMAWAVLVRRYGAMVKAIARGCRLNEADVAEVHQVTWLRMVEHIDRLRQPERIGAWLATTAKRESLRLARAGLRVHYDHDGLLQRPDGDTTPPDAGPIADERAAALRQAFALLPPHCRRLLGTLALGDGASYRDISAALSMPIGSIGPTRGRCLERLRRLLEDTGIDL